MLEEKVSEMGLKLVALAEKHHQQVPYVFSKYQDMTDRLKYTPETAYQLISIELSIDSLIARVNHSS